MAKKETTAKAKTPNPTPKKATEKAETPKPKEKKAELNLDHSKRYKFESNGTAATMKIKGKIYIVGGQVAEILTKRGFGQILD